MNKRELFNLFCELTSKVVDIPVERILSRSREEELVDARTIIAVMMSSEGYKSKQIAEIFGYSRARTCAVLSSIAFKAKYDKQFKRNLDDVNALYEAHVK